jgi:putative transposase
MCAYNHGCPFGEVLDGQVRLSAAGEILAECWIATPDHFSDVRLDSWVIMPDHLHGIVVVVATRASAPPASRSPRGPASRSIGAIVGSFKSAATKRINALAGRNRTPVWQRNYYEHIIRNDSDLQRIRRYIDENPMRWMSERESRRRL